MTEAKKKKKVVTSKEEVTAIEVPKKEINLSDTERDRILDQLFEDGFATIDIELYPKRKSITVKSLSSENRSELEEYMRTIEGSTSEVMHKYMKKCLSLGLTEVSSIRDGETTSQPFTTSEQTNKFLDRLPQIVIDKAGKAQHYFEKQISKAIDYDSIEEHFFGIPST